MTGNQAVAEELAQEVFLRVYRARDGYEPTAKFTTWLYRIATRLALNSIRDRKQERRVHSLDGVRQEDAPRLEAVDGRATREQEMLDQAGLDVIRRAVAELPEKQRAAVLMHKYEELDYQQIAGALDCSVSAVKSLLFRAYERLRTELAPLGRGAKKGPETVR
jgi:RNA polymerase sigma-70 factor (ECF subfamily)